MEECNVDFSTAKILKYHTLAPVQFKTKKKRLNAILILASENTQIDFDAFELKCNSNVEPEKGGFPEMDDFKWVAINEASTVLHESQARCLVEVKTIISKNER
jgi:predicted NUDIX family NTP pyrophosphohydrolase